MKALRHAGRLLLATTACLLPAVLLAPGWAAGGEAAPAQETTKEGPPQPPPHAEYIGTELCLQCHAQYNDAWLALRHNQYFRDEAKPQDRRGCEGCHGPGSAHLEDESFRSIKNPRRVNGIPAVDMCLKCHSTNIRATSWLRTSHARAGMNCATCHEPHYETSQPSMLRQSVNETCLSCHPEQKAEFRFNSHHPVLEGRMSCTDCHDPHHAEQSGLDEGTVLKTGSDQCLRCHMEKRGPFVFEHQVDPHDSTTGCMECHRPHGSPNPRLQQFFGRGTCIQCHTDIPFDPAHQRRGGDCYRSGCHSHFHGSNTNRLYIN